MSVGKVIAIAGGAGVLAWLGYNHLTAGQYGSIPRSGSPSILPALGRQRQPYPLGSGQAASYSGSAPLYQNTGNGAPPSSGVLKDAADAITVGRDAIKLGQAAADLFNSDAEISSPDLDAPSIPPFNT